MSKGLDRHAEGGHQDSTVSRRRILQTMGVASAAGLAGCQGGGDGTQTETESGDGSDGGDGDLGERVPTQTVEYLSGAGSLTSILENYAPGVQSDAEEIGIPLEAEPVEVLTALENMWNDNRQQQWLFTIHQTTQERLDPHFFTRRFAADWAGANGRGNHNNYANCEFTDLAIQQSVEPDPEARQEIVNDAQEIFSNDIMAVPLAPHVGYTLTRNDVMEPAGTGSAGFFPTNAEAFTATTVSDDTEYLSVQSTPSAVENSNWLVNTNILTLAQGSHIYNSPLVAYDPQFERRNVLAENVTRENEARTTVVELKDAVFSNGDQITAEDVQFTFQQLWDNPGVYPQASAPDYDSIDIIDDRTVEFNFPEPNVILLGRAFPKWGILHKESWIAGGIQEDPNNVQREELVTSGPFEIEEWRNGSFVQVAPRDDHPLFDPSVGYIFEGYQSEQTAFQNFQNGDLHVMTQASPGSVNQAENMGDTAGIQAWGGALPTLLFPHYPDPTVKFREYRLALAKALNKTEGVQINYFNRVDPPEYANVFMPEHPARAPDDRLTRMGPPEGDPEGARQVLEDAGWGWDDNGNLHYPPDADLSPLWPDGGEPSDTENYPCLDSENNYVPPDDR